MKLVKCENNHYYDGDKYNTCPVCTNFKEIPKENRTARAVRKEMDMVLPSELSLFQTKEILGESRTSKVFRMVPKGNYALKVVDIVKPSMESAVDHEYRIAQQLKGEEYFVDYYAMYKQNRMAYIVQPELRNLLTYIEEETPSLRQILMIMEDIIQAVIVLMKKGIVHLDIKPTNIFVDEKGNGKLGDFSTAQEISLFKKKPFRAGTPKYFSPEVYKKTGYSGKEDMYSLGISIYYILSGGKYPYDFAKTETRTADSAYIANKTIPEELQRIIKKATAYNPNDRYNSMTEMYNDFHMACRTSESYNICQASTYYKEEIAYTVPRPMESGQVSTYYEEEIAYSVPIPMESDDVQDTVSAIQFPADKSHEARTEKFTDGSLAFRKSSAILSPAPCFCSVCGARCSSTDVICFRCGRRLRDSNSSQGMPVSGVTNTTNNPPATSIRDTDAPAVSSYYAPLEISKVHFSVLAPRTFTKGEYTIIDIVMYQDEFRSVVDQIIKEADAPVQEKRSGLIKVREGARVKIQLSSPDIAIEDNVEEQEWVGEYLTYNFAVMLPENYAKRQVLFMATVYIDDLIATRLKFVAKCWSLRQQKIKVIQENVLSAFVSYSSEDRNYVAMIVQGMKKARPDMDIFFDVESLRSGESWEDALRFEIDQRDTLFLCWSRNAAKSPWVAREWQYCYKQKGAEAIEPVPLEPPSSCPPPEELKSKHFNDRLLYLIKAEAERNSNGDNTNKSWNNSDNGWNW